MSVLRSQRISLLVIAIVALICPRSVSAADESTLTNEQIKQFLLTAKVVKSKQSGKGITSPWRLTLSDGTVTHDGSFQAVDEHKTSSQFSSGRTELNFVDSYKFNIAAYTLAELLGIEDMMRVYVERKWRGNSGSLSGGYQCRWMKRSATSGKYKRPTQTRGTNKCIEFESSTNWWPTPMPTSLMCLLVQTGKSTG